MRRPGRVRRPISSKPGTCTEGLGVDAAGISVKVGRLADRIDHEVMVYALEPMGLAT
jgi:hypothetical protein